jgi:hypothetical protein
MYTEYVGKNYSQNTVCEQGDTNVLYKQFLLNYMKNTDDDTKKSYLKCILHNFFKKDNKNDNNDYDNLLKI